MLTIVLWKWSGKTMGERVEYSARHVNVMASMIDRNLKMPHRILCLTDDSAGIDGGVTALPLWPELREHGRCYVRLKAFAPGMRDILGERFVSLDLDTVIVGPLDPLFDRPESFIAWSDPSRITPYCGAQWLVKTGAHPEVWRDFKIDEARKLKERFGFFGSDQAWMAYKLPNAATWTKHDGVLSFKNHILKVKGGEPLPGRLKRHFDLYGPPKLPEHAKVIHFHGRMDPSMRFLRQSVPWIEAHWR